MMNYRFAQDGRPGDDHEALDGVSGGYKDSHPTPGFVQRCRHSHLRLILTHPQAQCLLTISHLYYLQYPSRYACKIRDLLPCPGRLRQCHSSRSSGGCSPAYAPPVFDHFLPLTSIRTQNARPRAPPIWARASYSSCSFSSSDSRYECIPPPPRSFLLLTSILASPKKS